MMSYNRPDIVNEIKIKRLEWVGHVWKKPEAMVKNGLQKNPRGKKPLRRPRMQLVDCVKKNVVDFYPEEDWHV